jgi:hypothetical protein
MLLRSHQPPCVRRRGVILIVVLSLLTLFAVVGLAFVLYADASAASSKLNKESESFQPPDYDPEKALALFLSQFIYDVPDYTDPTNQRPPAIHSALRGHSLARNMYGWNYPVTAVSTASSTINPWPISNSLAFNGTGRLHTAGGTAQAPTATPPDPGGTMYPPMNLFHRPGAGAGVNNMFDDYYLPNYTYFPQDVLPPPAPNAGKPFLRDPERYVSNVALMRSSPNDTLGNSTYVGGFNPSYTYPDNNAFYLAAVMADGTLLAPSYHRFDPNFGFGYLDGPTPTAPPGTIGVTQVNPLWGVDYTNTFNAVNPHPEAKYMTARYRPVDMGTDASGKYIFPYPEERTGDVKNLFWGSGGNDSIWVDIDAPVMVSADGRKFKMLIAPLILDLDNRLNVNVVGNILGKTAAAPGVPADVAHASNQGWGPWEISLAQVLTAKDANSNKFEWPRIFTGLGPAGTQRVMGRYGEHTIIGPPAVGPAPMPLSAQAPANGVGAHTYAPADYDGVWNTGPQVGQVSGPNAFLLPALPGVNPLAPPYRPYAYFAADVTKANPPVAYGNGYPTEYTVTHPSLFNPQRPYSFSGVDPNAILPAPRNVGYGMNRTFGHQETAALIRNGGPGADALAGDLFAMLRTNLQTVRTRQFLTTLSSDVDQGGFTPYFYDTTTAQDSYTGQSQTTAWPTGGALSMNMKNIINNTLTSLEYDGTLRNWMKYSVNSNTLVYRLGRLNLNRLADPNLRYPQKANNGPFTRADLAQFQKAQNARIQMAQDVFNVLVEVTGAPTTTPPLAATPTPTAALTWLSKTEVQTRRWLAQLAVNIVDFIDDDDISTPFVWYPAGGVTDPVLAMQNLTGNFRDPNDAGQFQLPDPAWPATTPYPPLGWNAHVVFGVEAPKLVMNEVYAQVENAPNDTLRVVGPPPGRVVTQEATQPYHVNFWVELLNPLPNDTTYAATGSGHAMLRANSVQNANAPWQRYSPYQIWITDGITNLNEINPGATAKQKATLNPEGTSNVLGDPDPPPLVPTIQGNIHAIVDDLANTAGADVFVAPVDSAFKTAPGGRQGFYLVGYNGPHNPRGTTPANAENPNLTAILSHGTANMSYTTRNAAAPPGPPGPFTGASPGLLLRRLACPNLPPNPIPTLGANGRVTYNWQPLGLGLPYNPYVTVDRITGGYTLQHAMQRNGPNPDIGAITSRQSFGRRQPLDALPLDMSASTLKQPNQPQHTFFQHNFQSPNPPTPRDVSTPQFQIPFDWMVHLDRQVVSPIELMYVAGVKPHQVTAAFAQRNGINFTAQHHLVPWTVEQMTPSGGTAPVTSARLYRLFEVMQAQSRVNGVMPGGRTPGKININTIWDPEVFLALCDAQPGNGFYDVPGVLNNNNANHYLYKPRATNILQSRNTLIFDTPPSIPPLPPEEPQTVYWRMMAQRSPGLIPPLIPPAFQAPPVSISLSDSPFTGFGAGYTTTGDAMSVLSPPTATGGTAQARGIRNTMLAPDPTANPTTSDPLRIFEPASTTQTTTLVTDPVTGRRVRKTFNNGLYTHPYQRFELLSKIFNNVTTRSNCFAVLLTVGFFEVTDDTARPVKLGREIGRAENRHIRHHMIALVDRTRLNVFDTTVDSTKLTATLAAQFPAPPTPPLPSTIPFSAGNPTPLGVLRLQGNVGPNFVFTPLINGLTTNPTVIKPNQPFQIILTDNYRAVPGQNGQVIATATPTARSGRTWQLQDGMTLTFDADSDNEETVVVQKVQPTTAPNPPPAMDPTNTGSMLMVTCQKDHCYTYLNNPNNTTPNKLSNLRVVCRGNPGPMPAAWDPRSDPELVPFFAVID